MKTKRMPTELQIKTMLRTSVNLFKCKPRTAGKRSNVTVFSARTPGVRPSPSAAADGAAEAAGAADDDTVAGESMVTVWLQ